MSSLRSNQLQYRSLSCCYSIFLIISGIAVSNAGKAIGIAVARQRLQHQETSSMRNVSLSHHTSHHATNYHFQPDSLGESSLSFGVTKLCLLDAICRITNILCLNFLNILK